MLDLSIEPGPAVFEGQSLHITAIADDNRRWPYPPPDPGQRITAVRLFLDRPPWQPGGPASVVMQPVDGALDTHAEIVELSLDTSGLEPGRHAVYIRAKDDAGVWGPVSAEFFWIHDPYDSPRRPEGRRAP